jgi:small subunit ribosomal protein S21
LEDLLRNKRNNDTVKGLTVEVRNGDFNGALRRFKKKVQEAGIIQEIRERQEYTKPSEVRKRAKAAGRARWLKKQRTMDLDYVPSNKKRK